MPPRRSSRLQRLLRRRGRVLAIGAAVVLAFVAALAYWGRGADLRTSNDRAAKLAPERRPEKATEIFL